MRIIPKTAKVKIEFFRNISLTDIIIALFGLLLEVLLFLTNIGFIKYLLMVILLSIIVGLYIPFDGQRFYMVFVNYTKYLFSIKKYNVNYKNSSTNIQSILPYRGIDDSFIIYDDYYAGVLEIDPREFRLLSGYKQDEIIDNEFGKIIRSISGKTKASLVKIDRFLSLESYIALEENKKDLLRKLFDSGEMTEKEENKMKCIAVDDEALALKVLVDAITEAIPNIEIFKTQSPKEALEYASRNVIDIAFCDITMHTMNGLELARHLKKYNPKLNIIFVTGYGEYLPEAFELHASGYITKPVAKNDILREMANLLHPIQSEVSGIYAKTFGNFELFVNGKPVFFLREKSKEMLAYFIDRRGAMVSKKEIIAILFEDRPYNRELQNYFTKIYGDLVKGLKDVGAEKILIKGYNKYGVDKTKFGCDLYEYLEGNPIAINNFNGEYMVQYEWAEYSIGNLYE